MCAACGAERTKVADFADRTGVAVLVIHHPPKGTPKKAIHAFSGSLGFVAAPRLGFIVAEEEGTERKLLLAAKNNVGPLAPGLGYHAVVTLVDGIKTSVIEWSREPVTVTATEALRAANGVGPSKVERAKNLLLDQLAKGPVAAGQLVENARAEGIGERTLWEAKRRLDVRAVKDRVFQGEWRWELPRQSS
jgi:hypothetical protein